MKIFFATDHAGFELKEALLAYVRDELGYEVEDCGARAFDPDDDYPAYMKIAATKVAEDPENARALLFGGSGQGEAMVANRLQNIRATVYYSHSLDIIRLSREHNDANVLSFGGRFVSLNDAKEAVALWLGTPFSGDERHVRRITQIDN